METKVELKFGYKDKDGIVHREVTFGKRPTVGDLVLLDSNPLATNPTHRTLLVRRLMITKFGSLEIPLKPNVMTTLDTYDDDELQRAGDRFLAESREGKQCEFVGDNVYRLAHPITIGEADFDTIKFGRRLTVADNIEADERRLGDGLARAVFQVCRQIVEISDSESGVKLDGQPEPDQFSTMDGEDFQMLRFAAEFFRLGVDSGSDGTDDENDNDGRKNDGLVGSGDPDDAETEVQ